MRNFLSAIGSLWLGAVLLVLLMLAMGSATVHEALFGTEQAMARFYAAPWFVGLLALFALNVLAGTAARYPFPPARIGFVMVHFGLVVILAGALVTQQAAVSGQVAIREGTSVDRFQVEAEELVLRQRQTQQQADLPLTGSAFAGFVPVDAPTARVLQLGDVELRIKRYLPDARFVERWVDDNPREWPALELSLGASAEATPAWVVAGEPAVVAGLTTSLERLADAAALERWLSAGDAEDRPAESRVVARIGGQDYAVALSACQAEPVPLGDTGYQLRVTDYLPHAVVGPDKQITNASNEPVNPAIKYELVGPAGTTPGVAFAQYPDMRSMHGETAPAPPVTVTFEPAERPQPRTPLELVVGPAGELYARLTPMNAGPAVTVELPVGEPVATPWGDRVLTVHRFFQHARRDWQAEAIEPAQPERSPALLVEIRAGELASDMWVARYNPQQLTINRAPYEIVYRQQSEPLGFRLGLERFRIGYYPGSDSPRSYESLVQLGDPASGVTQQAVVRMNQPVRFGGYSLFQSSFQQAGGQMVSVLGVVRDPGVSIVFAGYGLTFVGLLVVMGMRMAGIGPRPVAVPGEPGDATPGGAA